MTARRSHASSAALDEGCDFPSMIELFALTPDELRWEGPELFKVVLRDLGVGGRDTASRLLEGTLSIDDALVHLADLHVRTGYQHDDLEWAYVLKEEVDSIDAYGESYLGRSAAEVDANARNEATRILAGSAE